MVQRIILLVMLIHAISGSSIMAQERLSVEAIIDEIEGKTIYLIKREAETGWSVIDSSLAETNKVKFSQAIDELNVYVIEIEDAPGSIQFVWDNNIRIKGDYDSIWNAEIEGSKSTAVWEEYHKKHTDPARVKLIELSDQMQETSDSLELEEIGRQQRAILDSNRVENLKYIEKHPESFVSLYSLNHHARSSEIKQVSSLLTALAPYWQDHSMYQHISEWISKEERLSEGTLAPSFAAKSFEGELISLNSFKGNYVILDFWGTWCGPCIEVIPELRAFHEKHKNKPVKIVSVACEIGNNEAAMLNKAKKFVTKKNMDWLHIFENRANADQEESLIKLYNISTFPTTVLISPEGEILLNVRGKDEVHNLLNKLENELL